MLAAVPLYIDDTGGLSIGQLAARARRLKRQKGLDLIVIDYLQLLSGSAKKANENRVQELTEITTRAEGAGQGARSADHRRWRSSAARSSSATTSIRSLRTCANSGSIEQDADVVLFIYREEYYLKNKEPKEGTPEHLTWQGEMEKVHGRAEVIIGKQRHGPTGTVQLSFEAQYTRFGDLARSEYLPERME